MRTAAATMLLLALAAAGAAQPVARPVDPDKSASARVVVAVQPVGKIPYDGLTLPLVAPSGRFLVTQSGRSPSWDTVLAGRDQSPAVGVKLSVYELSLPEPVPPAREGEPRRDGSARPRPASLALAQPAEPLPPGLLLGRSADDRGFLVESVQPADGARWIGLVHWLTGRIDWLVHDESVAAHASLAPDGSPASLAYVRRDPKSRRFDLVVRARAEGQAPRTAEVTRDPDHDGSTLAFPFFSADGRTLAALSLPVDDPQGVVQLVAFDLAADGPRIALRPLGRIDLGRASDGIYSAFQCVAALQSPVTMPDAAGSTRADARTVFARGLLVFSPRDGGMLWWEPHGDHALTLAKGSSAAAPFQHSDFGLVLAGPGSARPVRANSRAGAGSSAGAGAGTGGEVLYQAMRLGGDGAGDAARAAPGEPMVGREVSLVASRAIPRSTRLPGGVTILLAAAQGDQDAFEVLLMAPGQAP